MAFAPADVPMIMLLARSIAEQTTSDTHETDSGPGAPLRRR
jgi:hypothetical protein